jgi:hypothetical protein
MRPAGSGVIRHSLAWSILIDVAWGVCSVHFLREALGHVRREQQGMVAALLRAIFNAETGEAARALIGDALERLRGPLPKVAALLEEAEEDLLAFLRLSRRPLAEAALDEPARAGQLRDRPPYRRRRHLPQRPRPPSARRFGGHRAE